ncbi:hypothetical protein Ciccas_002447 [Cichlidogyrus casuarinus]|uniref:Uncharacterized protein n=1 Tax=Cichlidogyrus casuarinus TaxID=1844966 RepID=A0ABD2QH62_9PLAT
MTSSSSSTWKLLDLNRLWSSLPSPASGWGLDNSSWLNIVRQGDAADQKEVDPEVKEFMREMLDKFTHLANYPPLLHPSLVVSVLAEWDAYVPGTGVAPLDSVYPGADLRYISQAGHVGAYLRNALWTHDFRDAICDSLNRQVELVSDWKEKGTFGMQRRSQETKKESGPNPSNQGLKAMVNYAVSKSNEPSQMMTLAGDTKNTNQDNSEEVIRSDHLKVK